MEDREIGYREVMPWDGSCFHRWINTAMIGDRPIKGFHRMCLLCGKEETWMYGDNGYGEARLEDVQP